MRKFKFKRKYILQIMSGEKTLEARVDYPHLRNVERGETVVFEWEDLSVEVKIAGIRRYPTVESMVENESSASLISGATKREAIVAYKEIYPDEIVRKHGGMVVFSFRIVK